MKHKLSTRVAAAVLTGALAFTVAACGSDDSELGERQQRFEPRRPSPRPRSA